MISPLAYILKNLRNRKIRTVLTISGVAICITFIIIMASLGQGMHDFIIKEMGKRSEGFIILISDDKPFNSTEVKIIEETALTYLREKDMKGRIYRTMFMPVIKQPLRGFGDEHFYMVGVDINGLRYTGAIYTFNETLLYGKHLNLNERSVVLGYEVWKNHYSRFMPGDLLDIVPVNLTWHNINQTPKKGIMNLTLSGVLSPNDKNQDRNIFMPLNIMQVEFGLLNETTNETYVPRISISIPSATKLNFDEMEEKLKTVINRGGGADNRKYLDTRWLLNMEKITNQWLVVVMIAVISIGIIGISNTMLMAVSERKREFGILMAIGIENKQIIYLVIFEALIVSISGFFIGAIAGGGMATYIDINESIDSILITPMSLKPVVITEAFLIAVIIGLIGAMYPARRAITMSPVDALRYE